MKPSHQLGDLQLAIMRVLWEREEATVAEVHRALLPERGLALTTIATMLKKMKAKGIVTYRTEGRQFVYSPTVAEQEVHRSMVGDLIDRLFGGNPSALVNHLLEERGIDPHELAELTAMIQRKLDEKGGGNGKQ